MDHGSKLKNARAKNLKTLPTFACREKRSQFRLNGNCHM